MTTPDTRLEDHDMVDYEQPSIGYGRGVTDRPRVLPHLFATLVLAGVAVVLAWLFLGAGVREGTPRIGDTSYQHAHVITPDSIK